ncbi:32718_t:CDS:2, partial [Racocetra persica]
NSKSLVNKDFKHKTAQTVSLLREFHDLVTVNLAKLNKVSSDETVVSQYQ